MKTNRRLFSATIILVAFIMIFSTSCHQKKDLKPKSTIDSILQSKVAAELKASMKMSHADWGCVALMTIDSGEIKALVNLNRDTAADKYLKAPNYAASKLIEPGQLFTIASIMACLQDKKISLTDSVSIGKAIFTNAEMEDANPAIKYTTIQKAFAMSSNVAIAKLVYNSFKTDPKKFINYLKEFRLDKPLGLPDAGEKTPVLKDPSSPSWSKISLPWMAIGYELKMTPLQILAFYNAIANNGKLIRPILSKCDTTTIPCVLMDKICSADVLTKAKMLLDSTMDKSPMRETSIPGTRVAGKSAVVKVFSGKDKQSVLMLCVGYFPADNPKYSCIVAINNYNQSYINWAPKTLKHIIGIIECGGDK